MSFFRRSFSRSALFTAGFCSLGAASMLTSPSWNSNNNSSSWSFSPPGGRRDGQPVVASCAAKQEEEEDAPTTVPFEDLYRICYALMEADEDYIATGHVSRDEVQKTVESNAYCQMGILEPAGVRELLKLINLSPQDIFCDVGCGYGQIVMHAFSETSVSKCRGVDILPSRIKWADMASMISKLFFSSLYYNDNREVDFIEGDFCDAEIAKKAFENCSVVFTHSWVFPPELMSQLGELMLEHGSSLRTVVTSREIPQFSAASEQWSKEYVELQADWNEKAPFFIYRRQ